MCFWCHRYCDFRVQHTFQYKPNNGKFCTPGLIFAFWNEGDLVDRYPRVQSWHIYVYYTISRYCKLKITMKENSAWKNFPSERLPVGTKRLNLLEIKPYVLKSKPERVAYRLGKRNEYWQYEYGSTMVE